MSDPSRDEAYRQFLASRWPARLRLLALYAFPASFAFCALDWAFTRSFATPPPLAEVAAVRLPWTAIPLAGWLLQRYAPAARSLRTVTLAGSVAWTWANVWAWFALGLGGTVVQALGLVLCFLCAAAFLPVTRLARAGIFLLFGAGHLALDLAWAQGRTIGQRLWTDAVIFLVVVAIAVIFEEFAAAQRRSFLLRRELQRSLAALEGGRGRVSATASGVAASAEQLEQSAAELASRSAASVEEGESMATASRRLADGARALQERSRASAATADGARQRAAAVRGVLQRMEAGVGDIGRAVDATDATFGQLRARADDVGAFVESAQDVAAQTHMLALNAGLLAATAGEHGRAFAVIATEIRRLSQDSSQGAAAMARVVGDMRRELEALLGALAEVRTRTGRFAEGFHEARATLETIDGTVQALGDAMAANAGDADQQADASLRVSQSIQRMAALLQAQAQVTADVAGTSTALAGHAAGLRGLLAAAAPLPGERERPDGS
jgi:methyl-accepting chemotaxis protein